MRIQQVMTWQPEVSHFGATNGQARSGSGATAIGTRSVPTWRQRLSSALESMIWMFQRSEGVGWLIALLVNIATVGWLGVALWSALFSIAIVLETLAEPVQSVD